MTETIPQMRKRHAKELHAVLTAQADRGATQSEAAKVLGLSRSGLHNIVRRNGINWPVIRRGFKSREIENV